MDDEGTKRGAERFIRCYEVAEGEESLSGDFLNYPRLNLKLANH